MTIFSDILADVYTLTNRPDLVLESKLGIRAATSKLHSIEYWREDRVEEEIVVVTANSQFSIPIAAGEVNDPFSYLPRPNNIIFKKSISDTIFEEINPKQLLDGFGFKRYNVYYQAGNSYKFLTDTGDTSVFCSYYRHPTVVEAIYESWIASLYPHIIATEAALHVASAIGDKDLAMRMERIATLNLAQLTINHLDPN